MKCPSSIKDYCAWKKKSESQPPERSKILFLNQTDLNFPGTLMPTAISTSLLSVLNKHGLCPSVSLWILLSGHNALFHLQSRTRRSETTVSAQYVVTSQGPALQSTFCRIFCAAICFTVMLHNIIFFNYLWQHKEIVHLHHYRLYVSEMPVPLIGAWSLTSANTNKMD